MFKGWNWRNWLTTSASIFAGGFAGYVESHITNLPTTGQAWEAIAIGGVMSGIIAVAHLYEEIGTKGSNT